MAMTSKTLYVEWPFESGTQQVPIVDVMNSHFALDDTPSTALSLQQAYEAEEQRQAKTPRLLRAIALRLGAKKSRLLDGLVHTSTNHLGGLHTYLMKLGAENLPTGFNSPIDYKVASTPHAVSMRLRLQQCATLLAEGMEETLAKSPTAPLHLINIAGGTAIDSLNALLILCQKNPVLLERPIKILVFDLDAIGPDFGARATKVLTQSGGPLSGLDLHFEHHRYNWSNIQPLMDQLQQSSLSVAIIVASSEGGLFEYANDSDIVANLKALATPNNGTQLVVGSVTSSHHLRRASIKRAHYKLIPRGVEGFRPLASHAGFEVSQIKSNPLSDQVALQHNHSITQSY